MSVPDKNIRFDFSIVNDMSYYNGVVFQGYVNNIPSSILSGGQYDNLMLKMGRKDKAIGFAVYLDLLQRFNNTEKQFDVDYILLKNDTDDISVLQQAGVLLASVPQTEEGTVDTDSTQWDEYIMLIEQVEEEADEEIEEEQPVTSLNIIEFIRFIAEYIKKLLISLLNI